MLTVPQLTLAQPACGWGLKIQPDTLHTSTLNSVSNGNISGAFTTPRALSVTTGGVLVSVLPVAVMSVTQGSVVGGVTGGTLAKSLTSPIDQVGDRGQEKGNIF